MKKAAIKAAKLAAVVLFGLVAVALPQNPKLKVADDLQVKILRIQKHISDLQVRANAAQSALQSASQDYQKSSKDLGDLIDQACKDAGLKREECDVDTESLEITKKAVPAAAPSLPTPAGKVPVNAPEKKKP